MMYLKLGFGRATQDAGIEIRRGAMTRDQAINLVNLYDGFYPEEYIQTYLDYYQMTQSEFDFVIDRSNKLCKNNVKTVDVIKDAIKKYEKFEFENTCCIYPCNPLLKVDDIKKCLKLSEKNKKKFIFPVREYSHPTERAFYLKGRNKKIK